MGGSWPLVQKRVLRMAYRDTEPPALQCGPEPSEAQSEAGDVEQGDCQGPDPPPHHHRVPGSFLSLPSAIPSQGLPRWVHQILEFFPVVTNYTAAQ